MKRCQITLLFLIIAFSYATLFSQATPIAEANRAVSVSGLMELFLVPSPSVKTVEELNRRAIDLVRTRGDVDFPGDETDQWVLKMAGAGEPLLAEIKRVRTAERETALQKERLSLGEEKIYFQQKALLSRLILLLYPRFDMSGRMKTVDACKEYLKRYDNDRYTDRGTDELLTWIKRQLPRMEGTIRRNREIDYKIVLPSADKISSHPNSTVILL